MDPLKPKNKDRGQEWHSKGGRIKSNQATEAIPSAYGIIPTGNYSGMMSSKGKIKPQNQKNEKKKQSADSIAAEMGDAIHKMYSTQLAMAGAITGAEATLVDKQNLLVGSVDAIAKDGTPIEIKTVSIGELQAMEQPRVEHVAQLQYYIRTMGAEKGLLIYIAREAPGQKKSFEIQANGRWSLPGDQALSYMVARRGGVDLAKFNYSLDKQIQGQRSNEFLISQFDRTVQEVQTHQKRLKAIREREDWQNTYRSLQAGLYEKSRGFSGFPQGGMGGALVGEAGWGSPWKGKKWLDLYDASLGYTESWAPPGHKPSSRAEDIFAIDSTAVPGESKKKNWFFFASKEEIRTHRDTTAQSVFRDQHRGFMKRIPDAEILANPSAFAKTHEAHQGTLYERVQKKTRYLQMLDEMLESESFPAKPYKHLSTFDESIVGGSQRYGHSSIPGFDTRLELDRRLAQRDLAGVNALIEEQQKALHRRGVDRYARQMQAPRHAPLALPAPQGPEFIPPVRPSHWRTHVPARPAVIDLEPSGVGPRGQERWVSLLSNRHRPDLPSQTHVLSPVSTMRSMEARVRELSTLHKNYWATPLFARPLPEQPSIYIGTSPLSHLLSRFPVPALERPPYASTLWPGSGVPVAQSVQAIPEPPKPTTRTIEVNAPILRTPTVVAPISSVEVPSPPPVITPIQSNQPIVATPPPPKPAPVVTNTPVNPVSSIEPPPVTPPSVIESNKSAPLPPPPKPVVTNTPVNPVSSVVSPPVAPPKPIAANQPIAPVSSTSGGDRPPKGSWRGKGSFIEPVYGPYKVDPIVLATAQTPIRPRPPVSSGTIQARHAPLPEMFVGGPISHLDPQLEEVSRVIYTTRTQLDTLYADRRQAQKDLRSAKKALEPFVDLKGVAVSAKHNNQVVQAVVQKKSAWLRRGVALVSEEKELEKEIARLQSPQYQQRALEQWNQERQAFRSFHGIPRGDVYSGKGSLLTPEDLIDAKKNPITVTSGTRLSNSAYRVVQTKKKGEVLKARGAYLRAKLDEALSEHKTVDQIHEELRLDALEKSQKRWEGRQEKRLLGIRERAEQRAGVELRSSARKFDQRYKGDWAAQHSGNLRGFFQRIAGLQDSTILDTLQPLRDKTKKTRAAIDAGYAPLRREERVLGRTQRVLRAYMRGEVRYGGRLDPTTAHFMRHVQLQDLEYEQLGVEANRSKTQKIARNRQRAFVQSPRIKEIIRQADALEIELDRTNRERKSFYEITDSYGESTSRLGKTQGRYYRVGNRYRRDTFRRLESYSTPVLERTQLEPHPSITSELEQLRQAKVDASKALPGSEVFYERLPSNQAYDAQINPLLKANRQVRQHRRGIQQISKLSLKMLAQQEQMFVNAAIPPINLKQLQLESLDTLFPQNTRAFQALPDDLQKTVDSLVSLQGSVQVTTAGPDPAPFDQKEFERAQKTYSRKRHGLVETRRSQLRSELPQKEKALSDAKAAALEASDALQNASTREQRRKKQEYNAKYEEYRKLNIETAQLRKEQQALAKEASVLSRLENTIKEGKSILSDQASQKPVNPYSLAEDFTSAFAKAQEQFQNRIETLQEQLRDKTLTDEQRLAIKDELRIVRRYSNHWSNSAFDPEKSFITPNLDTSRRQPSSLERWQRIQRELKSPKGRTNFIEALERFLKQAPAGTDKKAVRAIAELALDNSSKRKDVLEFVASQIAGFDSLPGESFEAKMQAFVASFKGRFGTSLDKKQRAWMSEAVQYVRKTHSLLDFEAAKGSNPSEIMNLGARALRIHKPFRKIETPQSWLVRAREPSSLLQAKTIEKRDFELAKDTYEGALLVSRDPQAHAAQVVERAHKNTRLQNYKEDKLFGKFKKAASDYDKAIRKRLKEYKEAIEDLKKARAQLAQRYDDLAKHHGVVQINESVNALLEESKKLSGQIKALREEIAKSKIELPGAGLARLRNEFKAFDPLIDALRAQQAQMAPLERELKQLQQVRKFGKKVTERVDTIQSTAQKKEAEILAERFDPQASLSRKVDEKEGRTLDDALRARAEAKTKKSAERIERIQAKIKNNEKALFQVAYAHRDAVHADEVLVATTHPSNTIPKEIQKLQAQLQEVQAEKAALITDFNNQRTERRGVVAQANERLSQIEKAIEEQKTALRQLLAKEKELLPDRIKNERSDILQKGVEARWNELQAQRAALREQGGMSGREIDERLWKGRSGNPHIDEEVGSRLFRRDMARAAREGLSRDTFLSQTNKEWYGAWTGLNKVLEKGTDPAARLDRQLTWEYSRASELENLVRSKNAEKILREGQWLGYNEEYLQKRIETMNEVPKGGRRKITQERWNLPDSDLTSLPPQPPRQTAAKRPFENLKGPLTFFDIETSIPKGSGFTTPYVFEFASASLTGDQVEQLKSLQGLEDVHKTLRQQIAMGQHQEVTNLRSSVLAPGTVARIQKAQSLGELVDAGVMGEDARRFYTERFVQQRKAGAPFSTVLDLVKADMQDVALSTIRDGQLVDKYADFHQATTLDQFIGSQRQMIQEIEQVAGRTSKSAWAGHNIGAFDIPKLLAHAEAMNTEVSNLRARAQGEFVDTLRSPLFKDFGQQLRKDLSHVGDLTYLGELLSGIEEGGKKGTLAGLERFSIAAGFVPQDVSKGGGGAHRALFDVVQENIPLVGYIQDYMSLPDDKRQERAQQLLQRFREMGEGQEVAPIRELPSIDLKAASRDLHGPSPLSHVQKPVHLDIPTPQFVRETREALSQASEVIGAGAKKIGHAAHEMDRAVYNFFNEGFQKRLAPSHMKNPTLGMVGLTLGGLGLAAVSLGTSGTPPTQWRNPMRHSGPIMSGKDEAHVIPSEESASRTASRTAYTDFGSGYQGMVGSISALFRVARHSTKPGSQLRLPNPGKGVAQAPKERMLPELLEQPIARPKSTAYPDIRIQNPMPLEQAGAQAVQGIQEKKRKITFRRKWFSHAENATEAHFRMGQGSIGHHRM